MMPIQRLTNGRPLSANPVARQAIWERQLRPHAGRSQIAAARWTDVRYRRADPARPGSIPAGVGQAV